MPPALRWVRAGASGVLLLLLPCFNCPLPPHPGEASHALPDACLECMSHANAHQRLAGLQVAAVDAAAAAAFEQHMTG